MRAHPGTIMLFALALPCCHGAAWGETPAADKAKASACDRHAFRTVIDVGHTANVPGAKSARGVYEYEFNLRLAKQVAQKLTAAGFERTVLLITSEAPRGGLFKRAARANAMGADLFFAVHHDSVPDPMLERWQYEGEDHTYNDRFPGHSIFISNDNPQRGRSLEFARLLGAQLKARGLTYTRHYTERFMGHYRRELVDAETGVYRYDQLVVLRSTQMPAVLLEAGSIINRKEELELAKPERVSLVADAALDAVESYCDAHGRRVAGGAPHAAHQQNPAPSTRPAAPPSASLRP